MQGPSQIAILVCSKFAADLHCKSASLQQICHDKSASVKQVCSKLTQASKSPWDELAANLQQTCTANSLQIIAKTEYEHNRGKNLRPTGSEADEATTRPVKR
ncbi:hypothetical protein AVEN_65110-1 [Araneus ventricosus]|uniref:Uncharacterized protein n=1 Tax=Araneus ventricosus TaxID=182803 RepID=A0A4Y2RWR5_ARAVE|nr:hypothetical protein AVEN_65110-1 [Araneus ventricosus]